MKSAESKDVCSLCFEVPLEETRYQIRLALIQDYYLKLLFISTTNVMELVGSK